MSRIVDRTPDDVPAVPSIAAAIAGAEADALPLMRATGERFAAQIRSETHDRSGNLDRSIGVSTRRLPGGGVSMRFGAIRQVTFDTRKGAPGASKQEAFYADFVDRGTGTHGPRGQRIKRRGLIRIGATVAAPSGEGQRPQGMFTRAAEAYDREREALDAEIEAALTRRMPR